MPPLPPLSALAAEPPAPIAFSDADTHEPRPTTSRPPSGRRTVFADGPIRPLRKEQVHRQASPDAPTYESDPPWEEIRASVPKSLLPCVTFFQPKPSTSAQAPLPPPASQDELYDNLMQSITASPPASLSQVLAYHAAHRSLHSTASFNTVIRYAIRCASFGTVIDLLARMVRGGIAGDQETRVLRVRSMVRSGFWTRAWEEEMAQAEAAGEEVEEKKEKKHKKDKKEKKHKKSED